MHSPTLATPMMIGEFCRASGLSADTVRFYVRKKLLVPRLGDKGGRNPYMIFDGEQLADTRIIRLGQMLGLSLNEIGGLIKEAHAEAPDEARTRERHVAMLDVQIERLAHKRAELASMQDYLCRKRAWLASGRQGDEPALSVEDAVDGGIGHHVGRGG